MIGSKFGRLTVIRLHLKGKNTLWECQCICGNKNYPSTTDLKSGNTKSCGCLAKELCIRRSTKHAMYGTRIYRIWSAIKRRCNYKKYPEYYLYGGRGISLDKKWLTFEGFYEDMSGSYADNLSIDRIDNDKGYFKENCKWATLIEQANNKRNNRMIRYMNETKSLASWCRELNLPYEKTRRRLNRGWKFTDVI